MCIVASITICLNKPYSAQSTFVKFEYFKKAPPARVCFTFSSPILITVIKTWFYILGEVFHKHFTLVALH